MKGKKKKMNKSKNKNQSKIEKKKEGPRTWRTRIWGTRMENNKKQKQNADWSMAKSRLRKRK